MQPGSAAGPKVDDGQCLEKRSAGRGKVLPDDLIEYTSLMSVFLSLGSFES